jgi:predicted DCC family thiol-disulfide oxidoreductase YuxK
MTETMPDKPVTVWYDSACPLCIREIGLMRRLDRAGRINFVDAVNPDNSCPIDRAEILARFHAMENGTLLSGAAAFATMWRVIPALRPLGLLAKLPGALWLLERAYLGFLRIRPRLQKWVAKA